MSFLDKPSKALTLVGLKSGTDLPGISTSGRYRPTNGRLDGTRDDEIQCQNGRSVGVAAHRADTAAVEQSGMLELRAETPLKLSHYPGEHRDNEAIGYLRLGRF